MNVYTTMESPVGELLLIGRPSPGGVTLTSVTMSGQRYAPEVRDGWRRDPAAFAEVIRQLTAYFAGELTTFSLDLAPRGTEFQQRVWQALDSVQYGTTITYGQLAAQLGVPRDRIQALGAAIGANPLAIIRPCHRVIGSDGGMRGYAAGWNASSNCSPTRARSWGPHGDQSLASSRHRSSAGTPSGASGLTTRMLLRACRHSSRLALSSISAGSPPWGGAPITMVLAPTVAGVLGDHPAGRAVIGGVQQQLALGRDAVRGQPVQVVPDQRPRRVQVLAVDRDVARGDVFRACTTCTAPAVGPASRAPRP